MNQSDSKYKLNKANLDFLFCNVDGMTFLFLSTMIIKIYSDRIVNKNKVQNIENIFKIRESK